MYLNSLFYKTLESKTLKLENIGNVTLGFPRVHWAFVNIKIIRTLADKLLNSFVKAVILVSYMHIFFLF